MTSSNPASKHRRRLAPLLRQTWYSLNQTFRRRIAHSGLTPDQFTVLRWITESHAKGATANELCEFMTCDPNTMTVLIRHMLRRGLVTRQPHETDGRSKRIRMTTLGRRKFDNVNQIALDLQQEILAVFPAGKRDRFLVELERLAQKCRSLPDRAPCAQS